MTINDVRSYWNRRPCNSRHGSVDIDEYPELYSADVSLRKCLVEPHITCFARYWDWAGKRVLELGCGIGTDTIKFAACGAEVTAIDISLKSAEIAIKRIMAEGVGQQVEFVGIGDIEKYREHRLRGLALYDLVYSFGVIHHTPNPDLAVLTAWKHVKPGGTFKLMLYNRYSWKVLRILIRNLGKLFQWKSIDKVVALESEAQTGCPITWTFTKKKARDLLESQGFTIQEMTVEHIFPYRVKDYIDGRYVKAFPWKFMPRRLFEWLEHRTGWHLCITAIKPKPIEQVLIESAHIIDGFEERIRDAFLEEKNGT